MNVIVFTYERPKMLEKVLTHLKTFNIQPTVYNDGVDFEHRGKKEFWKTWNEALQLCELPFGDLFLFMPDDFQDIDIKRIKEYHEEYKDKPYVFNIINDGRYEQWRRFRKQQPVKGVEEIGFTDCGFFCNREALDRIGYFMHPVNPRRFEQNPSLSSGVGQQLTYRFAKAGVKFYKPVKSLAYHGDHESKMNPEERIKNPLISK